MSSIILVTTPIGNLEDLTPRARNVLLEGSIILAEDTRVIKKLLKLIDISLSNKTIYAFHDHTKDKISFFINLLKEGNDLIIVSDAGSPIVSDPAYPLIKEAIRENFLIKTIPGVSSVISALELSGLPPHPFRFNGFLPREKNKLINTINNASTNTTQIYFEGIGRLKSTLEIFSNMEIEFDLVICREITKLNEEVLRIKNKKINKDFINKITFKGEVVLLVYKTAIVEEIDYLKLNKLSLDYINSPTKKKLAKILALSTKNKVEEIYNMI